ncbi:MAG: plasma-membrane proton-efflux P-type ATPase [Acidobacteria bacterium]|nr:plasma-membrane proton-efflux P-type ATPase [Acidobacteriota bacterium]
MDLQIKPTAEFKALSLQDTFNILHSSEPGLSASGVRERLAFFGRNEITEKKKNPVLEFLQRYWGPMPWLLEFAMVLAFLLGRAVDAEIIFALLTINAIIGFWHARGSQKAVELLKQRLAIQAKVLRDGKWATVEAGALVPGDVLLVKLGDLVPADAKIISGNVSVDESALTGESLPAERQSSELIYSGAVIRRGEAKCVALNTGANTYFGKTAELVKIAKPKSHQEEIMMAIVKYMMYLGIAASLVVAAYAFIMHVRPIEILSFIVVFLMGAVPVALPAVMTIVQAASAKEMAKEGVLVTRLDSIEDAASISVLCLDKTGTITQNQLAVAESIPFSDYSDEDVIRAAVLASRAEGMDLIDLAIINFAKSKGIDLDSQRQVTYTPFNPATKRTEALVDAGGHRYRVVKGAAPIVLSLCRGMDDQTLRETEAMIDILSRKGYRTLAVAQSSDGDLGNLKFTGLIPLADPPRPDSRQMIAEIRKLGVKPLMLTGDALPIAREIAGQVGIGTNIIRLADLEGLSDDAQAAKAAASDGFAEIYPEDKYKIVKLLQSQGYMVGMTGDGVNDAPALKQAEMGIAVSNATDVAKASASVVLTLPGVSVIVDAIKRSREAYQRMLTWVINKVTKTVQVVGLLTVGFFMIHHMVLTMLGVALLVFANDFVTMSLATDNVVHTTAPNNWNVKDITLAALIVGTLLGVGGVIALFWGADYFHLGLLQLQSFIMLMLIFNSQFQVLIVRERNFFWNSVPGKALLASSAGTLILFSLLGIYTRIVPPLTVPEVLGVLAFSAVYTLAMDFPKYYAFRKFNVE